MSHQGLAKHDVIPWQDPLLASPQAAHRHDRTEPPPGDVTAARAALALHPSQHRPHPLQTGNGVPKLGMGSTNWK